MCTPYFLFHVVLKEEKRGSFERHGSTAPQDEFFFSSGVGIDWSIGMPTVKASLLILIVCDVTSVIEERPRFPADFPITVRLPFFRLFFKVSIRSSCNYLPVKMVGKLRIDSSNVLFVQRLCCLERIV